VSAFSHIAVPSALAVEIMLAAAKARAEEIGVRVNIAIVDSGGNLAGFIRLPGAFLSSIDLAIDKAYTAASFSMGTRGFSELLSSAPAPVKEGLLRRPRLTEIPGGLPIAHDGVIAGAIGVSGGSEEEDEDIASFAVAELVAGMTQGRV